MHKGGPVQLLSERLQLVPSRRLRLGRGHAAIARRADVSVARRHLEHSVVTVQLGGETSPCARAGSRKLPVAVVERV